MNCIRTRKRGLPCSRVIFFLAVVLLPVSLVPPQIRAQERPIIFLVRHAERADDGAMTGQEDPPLSEAGFSRARMLAKLLKDAGIDHVYSSDFIRTRETAAPTAEEAGVEIEIYDHRDAEGFARELLATPGRHLVVGHSNSTPALVAALGGDPHGEIEHLEYDRLYLVTARPDGVDTVLLRFGRPFDG